MSQKIIFHYPGELFTETNTGEKLRPKKMLEAFHSLPYDVIEITGNYKERSKKIHLITKEKISFIYSENSNLPLSLCGEKKIPNFSSIDYQLFTLAKQYKIPSSVFIRDIFWLVKETSTKLPLWKQILGKYLFNHEIQFYTKFNNAIFLPSLQMKEYFTKTKLFSSYYSLPPAADLHLKSECIVKSKPLKFIYVGSCLPPVYLVLDGFKKILNVPNSTLTIVTRKEQHEALQKNLLPTKGNLTITTAYGQELSKILNEHDIALACVQSNEYWNLASPIKIYEYLGHGLPIITFNSGETAKLILSKDLGWVLENDQHFIKKIESISNQEIFSKRNNVAQFAKENTWKHRAQYIAKILFSQ